MQRAQEKTLQGGGAEAFRKAREDERAALHDLTEAGRSILSELGRPTAQAMQRLSDTLRAAATTDEGRDLLAAGRLTSELKPTGFDVFGSTEFTPTATRARRTDNRNRQLEKQLSDLRRKERDQAARVRAAEREQAQAEAAAASAAERAAAERRAAQLLDDERGAIEERIRRQKS